jgi:DNA-binding response OmpR family regulator
VTQSSPTAPAVLVVEDEADLLTTYRRLLGRDGFRVVAVSTRAAGLQALAAERFAVVIVDVRLPDGDGLDIVRQAREAAAPPPAIVVTGFASNHLRTAALAAGAADFFAKPFQAAALAARVRALAREAGTA